MKKVKIIFSHLLSDGGIGVGMALDATPPSKPDRRVSRIRLSSRWVLCREGSAFRLVPKKVGQTFGAGQVNCAWLTPPPVSPCGHSLRFFVRCSIRPSSTFLRSLRSTVVTRFFATTDALTPANQMRGLFAHRTHQHWRVSLIVASGLPAIPSPTISATTGDCPAARRFGFWPIARFAGFVFP
jgi:hypothetical protein